MAEFGSMHLEWTYLSEITGDDKYANKVIVQEITYMFDEIYLSKKNNMEILYFII